MKTKRPIEHNDLTAKNEDRAEYAVQREFNATTASDDEIIAKVLDHFVVTATVMTSFAERGML